MEVGFLFSLGPLINCELEIDLPEEAFPKE
jgi:hypothetical protein